MNNKVVYLQIDCCRLITFCACSCLYKCSSGICIIKQLLDEVEHDSDNYQGLSLYYLPQPSASADNTNFGLDNYHYHAQPHPIIVNY